MNTRSRFGAAGCRDFNQRWGERFGRSAIIFLRMSQPRALERFESFASSSNVVRMFEEGGQVALVVGLHAILFTEHLNDDGFERRDPLAGVIARYRICAVVRSLGDRLEAPQARQRAAAEVRALH